MAKQKYDWEWEDKGVRGVGDRSAYISRYLAKDVESVGRLLEDAMLMGNDMHGYGTSLGKYLSEDTSKKKKTPGTLLVSSSLPEPMIQNLVDRQGGQAEWINMYTVPGGLDARINSASLGVTNMDDAFDYLSEVHDKRRKEMNILEKLFNWYGPSDQSLLKERLVGNEFSKRINPVYISILNREASPKRVDKLVAQLDKVFYDTGEERRDTPTVQFQLGRSPMSGSKIKQEVKKLLRDLQAVKKKYKD